MESLQYCHACGGEGYLNGPSDCYVCKGTGWNDKKERVYCERCEALVLQSLAHISPDEDGNRVVCKACNDRLEVLSA